MSSPEEVARKYMEQKQQSMYERQNLAGGAVGTPLLPPAPPTCDAEPNGLARYWQLDKWVATLQEANRIRQNEALMKEIRMYLRMKKEEASNLIDEIG